jgi:replicative DNA helicase
MNLYITILKYLLTYNVYNKYYKYINKDFINKNYPELYKLYAVLPTLHKTQQDITYSNYDLQVILASEYPLIDLAFYAPVFEELDRVQVDETVILEYLEKASQREKALNLAKKALEVADGRSDFQVLKEAISSCEEPAPTESPDEVCYVTPSLVEILENYHLEKGLRWRLGSLNAALGELRKGNFGFVFARPETGKTTFLASELSFMAEQVDRPILWFNNEQAGVDVMLRIIQASLGLTDEEMRNDPKGSDEEFNRRTNGNLVLYDDGGLSKSTVERVIRECKPSLVVFDQIDNLKGFSADRNDIELGEIYRWARELCKTYCPIIGVCQAGATGENKKWLTMNDVDNSKTSKQGAADWILGIGKIHDNGQEYVRFMHLSKNKLHPEDKKMRHGKWATLIRPEVARYQDI